MTLEQLAGQLGLRSKGHLSEIEGSNRCASRIALAIEGLSGGAVDAASLNDDIAAARAPAIVAGAAGIPA